MVFIKDPQNPSWAPGPPLQGGDFAAFTVHPHDSQSTYMIPNAVHLHDSKHCSKPARESEGSGTLQDTDFIQRSASSDAAFTVCC